MQTTELMEQYASDDGFRTKYNNLWDAAVAYLRPAPTSSDVSLLQNQSADCCAQCGTCCGSL